MQVIPATVPLVKLDSNLQGMEERLVTKTRGPAKAGTEETVAEAETKAAEPPEGEEEAAEVPPMPPMTAAKAAAPNGKPEEETWGMDPKRTGEIPVKLAIASKTAKMAATTVAEVRGRNHLEPPLSKKKISLQHALRRW